MEVSKFLQKPRPVWSGEEDTTLYEENLDENVPHLPHSCRCVEQVLSRAAEALCEGEAEEPVDFQSVASTSSIPASALARRAPASPQGGSSGTGASASSTAPVALLGASPVVGTPPVAFSSPRSPTDDHRPPPLCSKAISAPVNSKAVAPSSSSGAAWSGFAEARGPTSKAALSSGSSSYADAVGGSAAARWLEKPTHSEVSQLPHVPFSPASLPSSAVSPPAAPRLELEDEHDRAVAAFLRENGFSALKRPRRQSFVGTTYPLHCAASQGLVRMTELLVKAGADPSQKNSWGQTPTDVARRCNRRGSHDSVLEVLQRATAA